jgi:hypothetical protein
LGGWSIIVCQSGDVEEDIDLLGGRLVILWQSGDIDVGFATRRLLL